MVMTMYPTIAILFNKRITISIIKEGVYIRHSPSQFPPRRRHQHRRNHPCQREDSSRRRRILDYDGNVLNLKNAPIQYWDTD